MMTPLHKWLTDKLLESNVLLKKINTNHASQVIYGLIIFVVCSCAPHTHIYSEENKAEYLTCAYCMAFLFSPDEVPLPIQTKSAALVSTMNTSWSNRPTPKVYIFEAQMHIFSMFMEKDVPACFHFGGWVGW